MLCMWGFTVTGFLKQISGKSKDDFSAHYFFQREAKAKCQGSKRIFRESEKHFISLREKPRLDVEKKENLLVRVRILCNGNESEYHPFHIPRTQNIYYCIAYCRPIYSLFIYFLLSNPIQTVESDVSPLGCHLIIQKDVRDRDPVESKSSIRHKPTNCRG